MEDVDKCPCCGQDRPIPTTPGSWEFRSWSGGQWLPVRTEWRDEAEPSESVEPDHDRAFLAVIPEYEGYLGDEKVGQEGEPMWWPGNAEWRKRE